MNWLRLPKKVYFKTGCTPVALKELKDIYNVRNAFIVTDSTIYRMDMYDRIAELMRNYNIRTAEFISAGGVATTCDVDSALVNIDGFNPDAIIGVGGGNVMSLAKAIWMKNEYPDEPLDNASWDNLGSAPVKKHKTKLILVSTNAGSGAECTPYAVINDCEKDIVLSSYEMLPEIAVIDSDFFKNTSKVLKKEAGLKVITSAARAYLNENADEYAEGLASEAVGLVLENLEKAINGCPKAIQNICNASAIAGIAYGNVVKKDDIKDGIFPSEEERQTVSKDRLTAMANKLGRAVNDKTADKLLEDIIALQSIKID